MYRFDLNFCSGIGSYNLKLLQRIMTNICRCGGIGRRGGFKIHFLQESGGSSPSTGTDNS